MRRISNLELKKFLKAKNAREIIVSYPVELREESDDNLRGAMEDSFVIQKRKQPPKQEQSIDRSFGTFDDESWQKSDSLVDQPLRNDSVQRSDNLVDEPLRDESVQRSNDVSTDDELDVWIRKKLVGNC